VVNCIPLTTKKTPDHTERPGHTTLEIQVCLGTGTKRWRC